MKRYFGAITFKIIVELERPEFLADIEDLPDLVKEICPDLYDGAWEAGLFIDDRERPRGTRCIIVETTPRLVLRLIIPPRLV